MNFDKEIDHLSSYEEFSLIVYEMFYSKDYQIFEDRVWKWFLFCYKKILSGKEIEAYMQISYIINILKMMIDDYNFDKQMGVKKNLSLYDRNLIKRIYSFGNNKDKYLLTLYYYIELYEYFKIKYNIHVKENIEFINHIKDEMNFKYQNLFFNKVDYISKNLYHKDIYIEKDSKEYISINDNFIFINNYENFNKIIKYFPNHIVCSNNKLDLNKKVNKNYFLTYNINKNNSKEFLIKEDKINNFIIRKYEDEDYELLLKYKKEENMYFPDYLKYKQLINSNMFKSILVLDKKQKEIVFTAHTNEIKNTCIIYGVQINKSYMNQRLGQKFLLIFINDLIKNHIYDISLFCENEKLKKYYENVGFQYIGPYYEYLKNNQN